MAHARIGPQLERAELAQLKNGSIYALAVDVELKLKLELELRLRLHLHLRLLLCELELIANPVSGRRTNCLAASRVCHSRISSL